MKAIKETIADIRNNIQSPYRGSEETLALVKEEIRQRPDLGPALADSFNPYTDAAPYGFWRKQGYVPRKGTKGIRSYTVTEHTDEKTGEVKKFKRTVILFHRTQLTPLSPFESREKSTV
jgi:hypothetical protein